MTTRTPWIPNLPAHWSSPALAHVAKLESGADFKTVETEPSDDAVPVIGSGGPFAHASRALYSGESVLLGRKGTVDKPLYWNGPFWTVDTMFYTVAGPRILPRFLYYVALTVDYSFFSTNTALPSVSGRDLREMRIPLPPREEQRRIAEFLDRETAQIDELIAKQEQLISTLAEREVTLITTVVGHRDASESPRRSGPLRRFLLSITDGAHISPETEGGLHDFVSTRDISDGKINFEGSLKTSPETYEYMVRTGCRPRPGDILFSKDGTVGKTAVVPTGQDFVVASSLVILQPDASTVESGFLDYVLRSHGVQAQVGLFVKGAGLPRISVANVGRLRVEIPSLESQLFAVRALDEALLSLRRLVKNAETAIDLLRERRQALISEAVTGQIDVGGAS